MHVVVSKPARAVRAYYDTANIDTHHDGPSSGRKKTRRVLPIDAHLVSVDLIDVTCGVCDTTPITSQPTDIAHVSYCDAATRDEHGSDAQCGTWHALTSRMTQCIYTCPS